VSPSRPRPADTGTSETEEGAVSEPAADTDAHTSIQVDTARPTCAPLALDEVLLRCANAAGGSDLVVLDHFWDPRDPTCPGWWQGAGQSAPTAADLIRSLACDTTCAWDLGTSVMFLHCGSRAEYIVWTSGDPVQTGSGPCPDQRHFASAAGGGWYADASAFTAAHPCP
jgi:hypothetical protein